MNRDSNWVCPECYVVLGGPLVPQSEALQRLVRHRQGSHHSTSGQNTLRAEEPSAVLETPLPIAAPATSRVMRLLTTCPKCNAQVREDHIQRHLRTVHDRDSKQALQASQPSQTVVNLPKRRPRRKKKSKGSIARKSRKGALDTARNLLRLGRSIKRANRVTARFVSGGRSESNPRRH
jgi:hypothetical protein